MTGLPHYPPNRSLEPTHLDLRVRVSISEQRLDIEQVWTIVAHSEGQRVLTLDGLNLLDLHAELPDGGRADYNGTRLQLTWTDAFERGEKRQLQVRYTVQSPVSGVLFSTALEKTPGVDSQTRSAAHFAVTDHETERARHWLLCVDHPSVRPTLEVELRADSGLTLLANGAIGKTQVHEDGTHSAFFSQRQACPSYLTCFAVGNFTQWSGGVHAGIHGKVPIAGFALPPFDAKHIERTFRRTAEMLTFLEERLGAPYPFEKYYQFAAPGIGGAMENISLVSWDERFLLDEQLEKEERQLIDIVNVHEMAHSWFGDSVVCRDHSHSWLKEGWATYVESCWLEAKGGPAAFAYDLWQCRQAYFSESDDNYQRAIVTRRYDSSFDLFDRHLYPGSGLRIHMLRKKLGDSVFWGAVSDYLQRFAGKLVETDDFRRVLETHSGQSLAQFFDQWFYSPGFPDLKVNFQFDAKAQQGTFEVLQEQSGESGSGQSMQFELEVSFGGSELGPPHCISVTEQRSVAVFSMSKEPERIRIDPHGKLLHRLQFAPGIPRLKRELHGTDPFGQIEAADLLASQGHAGVEAIVVAFSQQEHWEVRASFLQSLGKSRSMVGRKALMSLGESETDPRCAAPLYRALGQYRHATLSPYLVRHLEKDLGYRAREAALEALGAQRERAPLSPLTQAADAAQYGGFSQAGALRALGASRHSEALEPLVSALRSDSLAANVRPAAATGLGSLAKTLEKRPREVAIEALSDALQDDSPLVCLAAAEALGAAHAPEALTALRALATRLTHQDAARVHRVLRSLKQAPSRAEQQKNADKLEERVMELEAKIISLEATKEAQS